MRDGKVLLHLHRRQQLWLPPGGHIERDELPHHAAIREIEEETGLRLHLHSEDAADALAEKMDCGIVPQPAFILIEDINPFHQHIDFTYFALAPHDAQVPEHHGFAWFAPDDLTMDGVPQNVREGARLAVEWAAAANS